MKILDRLFSISDHSGHDHLSSIFGDRTKGISHRCFRPGQGEGINIPFVIDLKSAGKTCTLRQKILDRIPKFNKRLHAFAIKICEIQISKELLGIRDPGRDQCFGQHPHRIKRHVKISPRRDPHHICVAKSERNSVP